MLEHSRERCGGSVASETACGVKPRRVGAFVPRNQIGMGDEKIRIVGGAAHADFGGEGITKTLGGESNCEQDSHNM